jgi:hypothetical protein
VEGLGYGVGGVGATVAVLAIVFNFIKNRPKESSVQVNQNQGDTTSTGAHPSIVTQELCGAKHTALAGRVDRHEKRLDTVEKHLFKISNNTSRILERLEEK